MIDHPTRRKGFDIGTALAPYVPKWIGAEPIVSKFSGKQSLSQQKKAGYCAGAYYGGSEG